jgi:hypothetical protein
VGFCIDFQIHRAKPMDFFFCGGGGKRGGKGAGV